MSSLASFSLASFHGIMSRGDDVVIEVKEALKSLVGGKWVASYLDIRLKA